MYEWERCATCGVFGPVNGHKCKPAWWACGDPKGEEFMVMTVHADTADVAGEMYAKRHDFFESHVQEYQDVYVRRIDGDQTMYKVDVRMEMEPVYSSFGEPAVYVPEPDEEEDGDA